MNNVNDELMHILVDCTTAEDFQHYITHHATILQHLVCHMAQHLHQTEAGIRTLYATWADLTVEEFHDPRPVILTRLH